ncbi:MFS transporter [Consotaella salsifontis]|uniref:Major facilitator superfamily (MFS) profile domain-containing protein n=1 Tax=Consotaella salsifontis TaxID=1365950 RepID=A0A1T4PWL9_9HYPH|nr:MFS transporter [Consotaella salsifontis]SJZ95766.1 hypothetical protein SAMN05428963_104201 [Consotaella salsifontis]
MRSAAALQGAANAPAENDREAELHLVQDEQASETASSSRPEDRPDGATGSAEPASPEPLTRPDEKENKQTAATPEPPAAPQGKILAKPPLVAAGYMLASLLLGITYGLGMGFISVNLNQIAGPLGGTTTEAAWLSAVFMIPNASLTLLLIKIRGQYGLRKFAEVSIVVYLLVSLGHLWIDDLQSAMVVRFFAGVAASPMTSLAFLYMLDAFQPAKKLNIGLSLALTTISIGSPIARIISPYLLDVGGWRDLYIFEMGLSMIGLMAVYYLPLTSSTFPMKLGRTDCISYVGIFAGFGALSVASIMGRLYWWFEAPWLGWVFALGIAGFIMTAVIELNRKEPLLDIRWLLSREVLHIAAVLMLFRLALSEQSWGVPGFFQQMGLMNDQTQSLWIIVVAATFLAGLASAAVLKPERIHIIHAVAAALLAVGAFMDSRATSLTRPDQMVISQILVSFASGLFMPAAMVRGFSAALKNGPNYILSFIIVFLTTQKLGGMMGSAIFGTFVQMRERLHSSAIVSHLTATDPLVTQRIGQLAGAYAKTQPDAALRKAEGAALLAKTVTREAYVLAYDEAFLLIAAISVAGFAWIVGHSLYLALRERWAPSQAAAAA